MENIIKYLDEKILESENDYKIWENKNDNEAMRIEAHRRDCFTDIKAKIIGEANAQANVSGNEAIQSTNKKDGEVALPSDSILNNLLDDTDELLRHLEDFTHGKDGDAITETRHRIINYKREHLKARQ